MNGQPESSIERASAVNPRLAETTPPTGLSDAEVADRVAKGLGNAGGDRPSRSVAEILRGNILTRFNFILGALLVVILIVGQLQDALFGIVLVANALIGIVQELRAKRTLDRLAVLSAPRVRVMRNGEATEIGVESLVRDDVVVVRSGDQIVADGCVRESTGLQLDESLLTGESRPVDKYVNDSLLSGSFVSSGSGRYQATAVGTESYARQLAAEARQFSLVRSELIDGINRILRYVTWAIVPVAVLTTVSQLHANLSVDAALSGTVAALVGMVPQGLVLLTSVAFGVAAVGLARRRVLVQQLPAVEGLARVDVVCFDKTGTLTDGAIAFDRMIALDPDISLDGVLGALADDDNRNATLDAIGRRFPAPQGWVRQETVAFSSARKWSAASFAEHGTWVLGAPEVLLEDQSQAAAVAEQLAASGVRVVALASSSAPLVGESLPDRRRARALILFAEQLRPDAIDTVAYFTEQGVALKVMSGDSPLTVGSVAGQVHIPGAEEPIDARTLPDDLEDLGRILQEGSVFGRVTPRQKQAMVRALQGSGHTVAMTGDGVNDVLALKLADIGMAMGAGAPATKAVADLVLLDNSFASVPTVVAEGRRVTANIERVANVFLTKTVWATLLAILAGVALLPYPFLPRHLTIIDSLTIGIPCFFLALAPNLRRFRPGFVDRVLRFAVPAGIIIAGATFTTYAFAHYRGLPSAQQRTAATIITLALSLYVLVLVALPLTWRRVLLVMGVLVGFLVLFPLRSIRHFYALELPHGLLAVSLLTGVTGVALLTLLKVVLNRYDRSSAETHDRKSNGQDAGNAAGQLGVAPPR
jgi:cation-transporting ATPase E